MRFLEPWAPMPERTSARPPNKTEPLPNDARTANARFGRLIGEPANKPLRKLSTASLCASKVGWAVDALDAEAHEGMSNS